MSGTRPWCGAASGSLRVGTGRRHSGSLGGSGPWPCREHGANTSLHKEHKSSSLDSNRLGQQDSRTGWWSGGLWCWVGRERAGLKWRGDSAARRKGLGTAFFSLPTSSLLPAFSSLSPSLSPVHASVACVPHLSPHVHLGTCIHPCPGAPGQPPLTPPHSQAESCAVLSAISGTFLY